MPVHDLSSQPPPLEPLTSSRLKLQHANEHLKRIEQELFGFLKSKPYRVVVEIDSDAGDQVLRFQADREPPDLLGLLVGDCLHNFRCVLDHAVWDLGSLHGATPNPKLQFPICTDSHAFSSARGRQLIGIDPAHVTMIEELQPYKRWNNPVGAEDLWLLGALSNDDKHKVLNLAAYSIGGGTYSFPGGRRIPIEREALIYLGLVKNGTKIGRVKGLEPKVQVNSNPPINICFGHRTPAAGHGVIPLLRDIGKTAKSILRTFEFELS